MDSFNPSVAIVSLECHVLDWFTLPVLGGLLISYYLSFLIYSTHFHPLARYPGPRLLAVSKIPITYAIVAGTSPLWLRKLHDIYGPVVRVAPAELSYSDSSSWKGIYGSNASRREGMERDIAFFKAMEDGSDTPSIATANDVDHARIRRAYGSAFSSKGLNACEPLIVEHANLLICKLHKACGLPVDMVDLIRFTLFNIMGNLQFGESLRLLDVDTYVPWVKSQYDSVRASMILAGLSNFPWIRVILTLALPKVVKKHKELFFKLSKGIVERRLSIDIDRPGIIQLPFHRKEVVSENEFRANAAMMMTAGSETTVASLSGTIALLLHNPEALKKLRAEIRTAFPRSSDITLVAVNQLKFLDACVKESMRLYPPTPTPLPRVVPYPGTEISGEWVSGGTRVYNSQYATFRSSANFCDPDSFNPERWLAGSDAPFSGDNKDAYRPFSIGTRMCLAPDMANYTARLFVCKLIQQFDIELCTESLDWVSGQRAWTGWHKPPLMLKLSPFE